MSSSVNPYQPPKEGNPQNNRDGEAGSQDLFVELRPNKKFLGEASRRYLLWRHGFVLTVFSLVAILGGSALTVYLDQLGVLTFFAGQPLLALVVALIYQRIVRRSLRASDEQLRRHGISAATISRLLVHQPSNEIVLQNSSGEHRWRIPIEHAFKWRHGWILCLSQHIYIPISKRDIEDSYGKESEFRREFIKTIFHQTS